MQAVLWVLFLGGVAFALLQTFPSQGSERPFLRDALRRTQRQQRRVTARVNEVWRSRIQRAWENAGRPQDWQPERMGRTAVAAGMAVLLMGAVNAIEGSGVGGLLPGVLFGGVLMWMTPIGLARFLGNRAKIREIQESIQLLQTIEVYLLNGHSVKVGLEVCAESLPYMGPRIRQALLSWGQGPYHALDQFARATTDESTRLAIAAIKQAVDLGTEHLPVFLNREQEAVRKSRDALARANQARKPILFTLWLALPVIAYMVAFMMPLGITVASQVTHIGGP